MEIIIIVVLGGLLLAGVGRKLRKWFRYRRPQYKQYRPYQPYPIPKYNKTKTLDNKSEMTVPWGEQLLIKQLCRNFSILGPEAIIWHGLEYKTDKSFRQVDFLVLCQKGLFVLESKYWKGVSYVFDGEVVNLFENTMYHGFGQAKEEAVKTESESRFRVFNAQFNKEEGTMLLQTHQNPVVQVRNYARALAAILKNSNIKSVVIFATNDGCELRYNRQPLSSIKTIDKYTSIIIDSQVNDYFQSQQMIMSVDEIHRIKNIVEDNLTFYQKIDKTNFSRMVK